MYNKYVRMYCMHTCKYITVTHWILFSIMQNHHMKIKTTHSDFMVCKCTVCLYGLYVHTVHMYVCMMYECIYKQ